VFYSALHRVDPLLSGVKEANPLLTSREFPLMRHRFVRALSLVAHQLISVVLKTAITGLVFGICLVITLHYLGIPVPSPYDLIDKFEGLARLAKILS
jgi:hypothetical protein